MSAGEERSVVMKFVDEVAAFDVVPAHVERLDPAWIRELEFLVGFARRMKSCDVDSLPTKALQPFRTAIEEAAVAVRRAATIPTASDSEISEVRKVIRNAAAGIVTHGLSLLNFLSLDLSDHATNAKGNAERARVAANDAETARDDARRAAGEISVASFAESFGNQAWWNGVYAIGWLVITAALAWGTLDTAFVLLDRYESVWKETAKAESQGAFPTVLALGGVAVLSVMFFLLFLSGRMFRAQVHNAVMNRHRRSPQYVQGFRCRRRRGSRREGRDSTFRGTGYIHAATNGIHERQRG